MTEEVTDAMIEAGWNASRALMGIGPGSFPPTRTDAKTSYAAIYLAMRSASNSPTTNGEEYQQARTAYIDEFVGEWSGKRLIAANAYDAGYSRANLTPRAASDDEAERVARMLDGLFGPIIHCDSGDRLDWTDVVRAAIAALSTPTTDSAVDGPEAAKGGE